MLNLSVPTRRLNQAAILGLLLSGWVQGAEFDLIAAVKAARPGDVVQIPAGTFHCAGLELIPGVTLKGAGYQTVTSASPTPANPEYWPRVPPT